METVEEPMTGQSETLERLPLFKKKKKKQKMRKTPSISQCKANFCLEGNEKPLKGFEWALHDLKNISTRTLLATVLRVTCKGKNGGIKRAIRR